MNNKPEYVARRSAWTVCHFWEFLVFWLLVPAILYVVPCVVLECLEPLYGGLIVGGWFLMLIIILICNIIVIKSHRVEFYRDRVVEKWGVFDVEKRINVFTAVLAARVEQKFWGRVFGYGEVKVDMVGPWDIDLTRIKTPKKLQNYLETRIARVRGMHQFMPNF